ncbi:MAG: SIMPL domain-containing protein [Chloroflexi bacterium]|nr:SIMPL domain-containing protein [Chloroflexota bacterium]
MFSNQKVVRAALALTFVVTLVAGGLLAKQSKVEAGPARQNSTPRTITVTGQGTAYSAPDIAYMSVGVDNSNADVVTAVNDTNAKIQAVIDALKAAGVAPEDIRTEYYNIYQESNVYGPVAEGTTPPAPTYHVTNVINVTVRDVAQIGNLLATAVTAGANIVNNISFDISERAALETTARTDAFADATARATEIAGLLGGTLGEVVSVQEGDAGYYPMAASERAMGGGAGNVPIAGGTLSVNISLTVTFAIN